MTKVMVVRASIMKLKRSRGRDYYALYPHGDGQEKLRQLYGRVGEVDVIIIAEEG